MGSWELKRDARLKNAYVKKKAGLSPCKGCSNRRVGCHAECKIYKQWNENRLNAKNDFYDEFAEIHNADILDNKRIARMCICRKNTLGKLNSKERTYYRNVYGYWELRR